MTPQPYFDEKYLVVPKKAALPDFCLGCGQPAEIERVKKTFSWHHPAFYLLIVLGLLPYALAATFASEKLTLHMPLCREHLERYRKARLVGWILFLAAVPLALALAIYTPLGGGWCFLIGLALIIAGAVQHDRGGSFLKVKKITEENGYFTGPSREFLVRLQPHPEAIAVR